MTDASTTLLVTGGGAGIGLGLASAFHARGAKVIIAGRDLERLKAAAAHYPGMAVEEMDVADAASVTACAERVARAYPDLNAVISNAGVQRELDFARDDPLDVRVIDQEVDTNLKGVIYVANAFLPQLKRQPQARLIHIGSGLAYVPIVGVPVYCATKAAVHSFTISLRRQLAGSRVTVIEILPPVVETGLHRDQSHMPPGAMTLEAFVAGAMKGIESGRTEVPVGRARILRIGSRVNPGFFLSVINKPRRR